MLPTTMERHDTYYPYTKHNGPTMLPAAKKVPMGPPDPLLDRYLLSACHIRDSEPPSMDEASSGKGDERGERG